jgi:D-arabinose 5-phosphate isomerase GutQ
MNAEALAAAKAAYQIEADCILEELAYLDDDQFMKAVDVLAKAPRIGTSGCGHSGIICQHMAHLMCCIERPARFISPAEAVHGATGFIQAGDVMILASRGGKTAELLPILRICKEKGATIISVTENLESPLAQGADIVLKMHVNRETDKYNSQGTTSTTALCVIFHALQAALIEVTGFKNEQFALIHPGGAVGERLNKH